MVVLFPRYVGTIIGGKFSSGAGIGIRIAEHQHIRGLMFL